MISTMAPEGPLPRRRHRSRRERLSLGRAPGAPGHRWPSWTTRAACSAPGERGEIVVRGSLVMAGYYKDPEATAEAARHGWHHTGDIGYLDEDSYLFIVDRAKDMIITGGFNVYSAEVEQALLAHPAVQDCAVVGLPDDKWGERVTAVVQPHPGQHRHRGRAARLRQGPAGQRQGPQAGRGVARPAPLQGRQGAQGRHQGHPARRTGRPRRLTRLAPGLPVDRVRLTMWSTPGRQRGQGPAAAREQGIVCYS